MTTEEDNDIDDEPAAPKASMKRRKATRSPTPPSAEEFLEITAVRVLLKVNGKPEKTSKMVNCDFNLDYVEFTKFFHPVLYRKAREVYDPMGSQGIKIKYTFATQARLTNIGKAPLLDTEYTDLDEEHNYEALQNILQKKARNTKSDAQLVFHATIVTSISPKSPPTKPINADLNDGESSRNQVPFPSLMCH